MSGLSVSLLRSRSNENGSCTLFAFLPDFKLIHVVRLVDIDFATVAVPGHSRPGESASNGLAERSGQLSRTTPTRQTCTWKHTMEEVLPITHPLVVRLVERSSYLLTKFRRGTDGRAGWGLLHGNEARVKPCDCGKSMRYKPKIQFSNVTVIWRYGTILGRGLNSVQGCVGLSNCTVIRSRAVVRLITEQRWDLPMHKYLRAIPHTERQRSQDMRGDNNSLTTTCTTPRMDDDHVQRSTPRVRVTQSELAHYVVTDGCTNCCQHGRGNHARAQSRRHSEQCRGRNCQRIRQDASFKANSADAQGGSKTHVQLPQQQPATASANSRPKDLHLDSADGIETSENVPIPDGMSQSEDAFGNPRQLVQHMKADQRIDSITPDNDHERIAMMAVLQTLGVNAETKCGSSSSTVREHGCCQRLLPCLANKQMHVAATTEARPTVMDFWGAAA